MTRNPNYFRTGDTLVVRRLDRLDRFVEHLIQMAGPGRGTGSKTFTVRLDTTILGGKLVFHVFGALAEFERDLVRERTHAGLAAARARGRKGGRPKKLADPKKLALAQKLYADGQSDIATICTTLGISRAILYRSIGKRADPADQPS